MPKKQTIAIFLCLAMAAGLAALAGCGEITLGNKPDPERTTAFQMPQSIAPGAASLLEGLTLPDINDDKANQAVLESLAREGIVGMTIENGQIQMTFPPGVTEEITTAPPPPPTTMPAGQKVESSEVYDLIKKVNELFGSGNLYLRGRSAMPAEMGFAAAGFSAPMTVAVLDGNKMMIETTNDWSAMGQMMNEGGKNDFGASRVQAAVLTTTFGKKTRMVFADNTFFIVFPDKKKYIDPSSLMGALSAELGEELPPELSAELGEDFDFSDLPLDLSALGFGTGGGEVPKDIPSSKVTTGGKDYLCATMETKDDESGKVVMTTKFYFLNGELKRMETYGENPDEMMIMEIDELHGKPDPKLFTTEGMKSAPINDFLNLMQMGGGGLGGLFGG